ncbi:MAG TPA: thioredoxin family protein [Planctomycetota bacterium]
MGPQLAALATQHAQVKLRRVDIVSWDSPVAAQFSIRQLPTIWLYEDGELYSKDRTKVTARLSALK